MGTLFKQEPRNFHRIENSEKLIEQIEILKKVQKKTGLTYEQVIDTCKMLELRRRNNLYADNGDIFDEQMTGFGELLQELISTISED